MTPFYFEAKPDPTNPREHLHADSLTRLEYPTMKGSSRIAESCERGDRRSYNTPCPHCSEMQTIEWKNIKYEEKAPITSLATVYLERVYCKKRFTNTTRPQCWRRAVKEYLESDNDPLKRKTRVNTVLGEAYEETVNNITFDSVYRAKRGIYKRGAVPEEVLFPT